MRKKPNYKKAYEDLLKSLEFVPEPETLSLINKIFRGILGLLSLIFLAFIFSKNKRNINWS